MKNEKITVEVEEEKYAVRLQKPEETKKEYINYLMNTLKEEKPIVYDAKKDDQTEEEYQLAKAVQLSIYEQDIYVQAYKIYKTIEMIQKEKTNIENQDTISDEELEEFLEQQEKFDEEIDETIEPSEEKAKSTQQEKQEKLASTEEDTEEVKRQLNPFYALTTLFSRKKKRQKQEEVEEQEEMENEEEVEEEKKNTGTHPLRAIKKVLVGIISFISHPILTWKSWEKPAKQEEVEEQKPSEEKAEEQKPNKKEEKIQDLQKELASQKEELKELRSQLSKMTENHGIRRAIEQYNQINESLEEETKTTNNPEIKSQVEKQVQEKMKGKDKKINALLIDEMHPMYSEKTREEYQDSYDFYARFWNDPAVSNMLDIHEKTFDKSQNKQKTKTKSK